MPGKHVGSELSPGFRQIFVEHVVAESDKDEPYLRLVVGSIYHSFSGDKVSHKNVTDAELFIGPDTCRWLLKNINDWLSEREKDGRRKSSKKS